MNKQNLILTSTVGMPRETWLEFRQPINHIKNFLDQKLRADIAPGVNRDAFWSMSMAETIYPMLKEFFNSKDWKEFIFPCLGASEIAAILGLNPYKSSIELYFEKIGAKEVYDFDNVAMFWGRELEAEIANKWEYWDGSPEALIENFKNKNLIRRCRRLNAYVQNKQYPWLFVSLDRVINKQKAAEEVVDEGSLECKTISGFSANMWEGGIPIMYVAQLQAQLLACDFQYGEIAILKDGRYFEVYPFDRHEDLVTRIANESKAFFELVKKGAQEFVLHTYAPADYDKQNHYAELERIAPEPDGSESYKNYLSEKYTSDKGEGIIGGIVEVELAMSYKYYGEKQKQFDVLQTECSNKLKAFMKENGKLDLGEAGSCTWKENGKGSRTFRVNVKLPADFKPKSFQEEEKPVAEEVAFDNNRTGKRTKKAAAKSE